MTILNKIIKADDAEPGYDTLIYGKSGTGKTTFFSTYPGPRLLIDCNEGGIESLRGTDTDTISCGSFEEVDTVITALEKQDFAYDSIALDTVSNIQQMCVSMYAKKYKKKDFSIKDWNIISQLMKDILYRFLDLPCISVLIAQERVFEPRETESNSAITIYPYRSAALQPALESAMTAAVDIVLRADAFVNNRSHVTEDSTGRRVPKELKTTCFRIQLRSDEYNIAKVRSARDAHVPFYQMDPSFNKLHFIITGEK